MRKLTKNDQPALIEFFSNNKDTDFFDPFPLNDESARMIIDSQNNDLFYSIFDGDKIIGFGMLRWYKYYKSPTLGLIVDKNHQGLGLGKKIYSTLFEKTKEAGAEAVIAIVHKNNKSSMHIAKKLGMTELNNEYLYHEGRYDFMDYALANKDKEILIKKMNPKVSVCIITYNHEKYIAQAIEGVLSQVVDFDYEIVLGEDCSTDKTREIVLEYSRKYPDKFKLLLPEKNNGMMENFVNTLQACTGQYIALCEGDDYWTDPNKLQKQVDFLDNNLEYAICSHGVNVVYEGSDKPRQLWHRDWAKNGEASIEGVITAGGGATCSLIFRNRIFGDFPDWFKKQRGGDWSIQILCADKGKMKYLPEIMAIYRVHDNGTYSAAVEEAKKKNIDLVWYLFDNMDQMLEALDKHFNYRYKKLFDGVRNLNYLDTFSRYAIIGDYENSRKYLKKIWPQILNFPAKSIIKIIAKYLIINIFSKKYSLAILNFNKYKKA